MADAKLLFAFFFFFSSRRRHTRWTGDWSSDVCSSDLVSLPGSTFDYTREGAPRQGDRAADASPRQARARTAAAAAQEIGRASCRERVEISVGGVSLKKKRLEEEARQTWHRREVARAHC